MKTFPANVSQRAFTLIELMIAMLIGVFLMMGVIQIFISAKQAYQLQENLSRLQENGRFVMDVITKDMRMAGFMGCASKATPNITYSGPKPIPALSTGIMGISFEGSNKWNDSAACGNPNECIAGTDVISFQSASYCNGKLADDTTDKSADLKIATPNDCGLKQGDVVILSSCSAVDIFGITDKPNEANKKENIAHGGNLNKLSTGNKLGSPYSQYKAEILVPQLYSYFFRTGADGTPALWRIDNAKDANPSSAGGTLDPDAPENPVELISGIENMKILYGVDIPNVKGEYDFIPNFYVKASDITDWGKVVSIRVSLLVVSTDNGLTDTPQTYLYNGATVQPPDICFYNGVITQPPCTAPAIEVEDRRIHRSFSSTIAVRNRLL